MEVRELLNLYNAPDVELNDIICQTNPQKRLLSLLMKNGVLTTQQLRNMSDEEIMDEIKIFGEWKLEKLHEFITDWYENDFPVYNRLNVSKPLTVLQSLQEDVFITYKNLQIVAMRETQTYESIGRYFGQSRQSVKDKEKYTQRKFVTWFVENRIMDKIGNMDEFVFYCERNFPEDQRMMKTAVKRLVMLTNRELEKKEQL